MKNYQSRSYKNYYLQNKKGEYIQVSRKDCFAPADLPTVDNPYKQRWFYDLEADYAVRLERSELGERIYRFNDTSLKSEERYRNRKFSCIWKDTSKCNQNCNECSIKNTSRTVELDKNWTSENSDEMVSSFEPIDESQDIVAIIENKELLSTLSSSLEKLSEDDIKLYNSLLNKEKKKVIATKLNLKSVDGVRYRELELRKKLLLNKNLKDLLKK